MTFLNKISKKIPGFVFLAIFIVSFFISSPVLASETKNRVEVVDPVIKPKVVTLGNTGTQPIKLVRDTYGNIFTANRTSNTVTKITPSGTSVDAFGNPSLVFAYTGLDPVDIAIDAYNNLYTINQVSNTVTKIKPNGATTTFASTQPHPLSIEVDLNNNVYVSYATHNYLTKITPFGVTNHMFGDLTAGFLATNPDAMTEGTDIIIGTNNTIYVNTFVGSASTGFLFHGIVKVNATTGASAVFASLPMDRGMYLARDYSNTLYLVTTDVYQTSGVYEVKRITSGGASTLYAGLTQWPMDIAADFFGNVYVSIDTQLPTQGSVQKISSTGVSSVMGQTGISPWGIIVDQGGNVFTADYLSGTVTKLLP